MTGMTCSFNSSNYVLFAVMERGSSWPSCIQQCRRLTHDSVVIAQHADETPVELLERVRKKLRALTSEGRRVSTAVLATAEAPPADLVACRDQIAQALLQATDDAEGLEAKLCLVGSASMRATVRHDIMALAGKLVNQSRRQVPTIDVKFMGPTNTDFGTVAPTIQCPHAAGVIRTSTRDRTSITERVTPTEPFVLG
jgi:hypothetical protein